MLANPEVREKDLRLIRITSHHVTEGNRASLHLRSLLKAMRLPVAELQQHAALNVPVALRSDLRVLTRATVYAVAERQLLWKYILVPTYEIAMKRARLASGQAASAIEVAFDDCLTHAA